MHLLTTKVTSLELREPPDGPIAEPDIDDPLQLSEIFDIPLADYRALYRAVGDPHHWTSRILPDDLLARELYNGSTRIFLLSRGNQAAGWFEIEMRRTIKEARIVHLAVLASFRGKHLAGYLLDHAIRAAFESGIQRLTIETNTLDHPAALPLYQRRGFRIYATRQVQTPAIETKLDDAPAAGATSGVGR